jgi:hypothetical protein
MAVHTLLCSSPTSAAAFLTLFYVLGAVLVVLGLSGGITYSGWLPIVEVPSRVGAVVIGLVFVAIGLWRQQTHRSVNADKYHSVGASRGISQKDIR